MRKSPNYNIEQEGYLTERINEIITYSFIGLIGLSILFKERFLSRNYLEGKVGG